MKRHIAAIGALVLGVMWISSALAFDLTDPQSWPFIPVPEIATDPNGGTTVGILPVFLFTDTKNQIRDIFAPDLNWNQTLGVGGTFRYLSYPSEDTNWYATAGGAQDIARQIDLDYQTGRTHQDLFTFEGRFFFERDPTDRFYGTGNNSSTSNETTYTTQQLYGMASVGLNISDKLQVQLMERPRWVRIQNGAYTSLPQIFQLFPHQKGINGGSEVLTQLMIQYDDRDSVDIPRSGGLYRVYGSVADRALGSSFSYTRFGYEARKYYTVHPRITFAGHVFMEYEPAGNEMPFWAQARLGGDQSILTDQQPLRGFGSGRYIDNNLVVANIEMRNRVYDANLFGTHGTLEIAPFAEAGRVAHQLGYNPVSELHPVGGVGFRGIAEPFVVGFVDVGYGGQGAAIFSGINYPF
ncbi:MAG TPA: BamA/TamA family outer membrane protein [Candidatus Binataceae bacterium]|jgi:outer membrane protein assembly factor BamA